MGVWEHEIIFERWIKALLILCKVFTTQQTIWSMLCWLTDCTEEWLNKWMSRMNDEWKNKVPIPHETQVSPAISQKYVFVNRSEHHLTYETKSQLKNNHKFWFNHKEMICYLFPTVLKMKFSLNPQEQTLNVSVLYSAQQTHLAVPWPLDVPFANTSFCPSLLT